MSAAVAPELPEAPSTPGAKRALLRERELRRQIFKPPPKLTISEWADKHRYLSSLSSAEPGRWHTSRAPYQRGIMDAISDPAVNQVVWIAPSQVGKSELELNTMGFFIDQDPSPILMVQPTLEAARDFSEDRVKEGLINASPRLKKKLGTPSGRREAGNKMLRKVFPGGHLTLVGANSATGLAARPIRVLLFDEVDKYPISAGDKGDPIALAVNRTKTFWNKKIVKVTTPGVKGASRIEPDWEESDQRRYFVPCPFCAHLQHLTWEGLKFDPATGALDGYACEGCGVLIEERYKPSMLDAGVWVKTNPNGAFPGFHINALYSPWSSWADLVKKFLKAKKAPDTLQVFVNEDLAEWWDPQDGVKIDDKSLKARRETYPAEVPAAVGVLVAFVDVQRDWLEVLVKGYGAGQESWAIAHHRIRGSVKNPDGTTNMGVWERLDPILTKTYQHEGGAQLHISVAGVDSGDGETIHAVYDFVAPRQKRKVCPVFATKGSSMRGRPILAGSPSKKNKYGVRVYPVGTDTAKDTIFPRLRLALPEDGAPPPGFMHFPVVQADGGCDDEYLEQFSRERAFTRFSHGVAYRVYEVVPSGARNEAIDLEVGCLHMLHVLGVSVHSNLAPWVAKVQAEGARVMARTAPAQAVAPKAPDEPPPPPGVQLTPLPQKPPPPRRPPSHGGGYISGGRWRR